jgi:hypothetical protein
MTVNSYEKFYHDEKYRWPELKQQHTTKRALGAVTMR